MFHPTGVVLRGEVTAIGEEPVARALARRLQGPALLRWSSAWWKRREWPDVLGCAIRFTELPLRSDPHDSDQDLLFATIRRPWTMAFAPLATRYHDFLDNDYYAVSPFQAGDLGRVEWRLRPVAPSPHARSRDARLLAACEQKAAAVLEYAPYRDPLHVGDDRAFRPLARVELREPITIDQSALRFDPFRAGRGIVPVGIIHGLRRATYASSRLQHGPR